MIVELEQKREQVEKRKKLIILLSKEGYLQADHDYRQIKFRMCEPTQEGVQVDIFVEEDCLRIDLLVPFNDVNSDRELAYDYCRDVARTILDEQTDARCFDHNYFTDDIIFHYVMELDKMSPDLIIRQLRLAVDVSRNGPF